MPQKPLVPLNTERFMSDQALGLRQAPHIGVVGLPKPPAAPALAAAPAAPLAVAQDGAPQAQYEYALTCAAMGFHQSAMEALQRLTLRAPDHEAAWRSLAALLRLAARDAEADEAEARAQSAASGKAVWPQAAGERSPARLEKADRKWAAALSRLDPAESAPVLRDALFADPLDVVAMRYLSLAERQLDDTATALWLLERALLLSPAYTAARRDYVNLLMYRRRYTQALAELDPLLAQMPRDAHLRGTKADLLGLLGRHPEALVILEALIKEYPRNTAYWLVYANALRQVGRRAESIAAYRHCLELKPANGQAYWGLADHKGNLLTAQDVEAMRALRAQGMLTGEARVRLCYALGHTLERAGEYEASFEAYAEGARAFCAISDGWAEAVPLLAKRLKALKEVLSAERLAHWALPAAAANPEVTPIFVVGMPRAGSTLVEQILASHSMVEGTQELPVMGEIVRGLATSRLLATPDAYPGCLTELTQAQCAELGARYIRNAGAYRSTMKPYFVDKRPWNWLDAALIRLILPHAKIIDVRRAPMAACFAMFKQVLPEDASFSYNFDSLAGYYNHYVGMMDHYRTGLPGWIHYLRYEDLVENTEAEIRRMLAFCGLPFEEGCLRFWQTERTVTTPSAEQVRRPIFKDALEQWRHFEPWLGPLKAALAAPPQG